MQCDTATWKLTMGQELVHQISNTTAKVILAHPKMLPSILEAAAKTGLSKDKIFQFSDQRNPPLHGVPDWQDMIGTPQQGESWQWPNLSSREATTTVATINYSSGTTGLPKGVCVSHYNLIANVEQTIVMRYAKKPYPFEKRPKERWVGFLPLYHAYGQLYTILMAIKLNVPVYVMAEFRYEDFLAVIGKYKITSLQIAPPILVMLSKRPETARYDLSSVRDVLCGAAPLSRELQNECQRRFDIQINQGWGMTEVTCGALHVPGGVKDDSGSVGQLDPNCECKLVDDDGNEVEMGKPGEMYVRGPNVCMRYWRNEVATKESLDEQGWLKTGDIAICNKEGYFWIVDRKKVRMIRLSILEHTLICCRNSSRSMHYKLRRLSSRLHSLRTSTSQTQLLSASPCKCSDVLHQCPTNVTLQQRQRVAARLRCDPGSIQRQGHTAEHCRLVGSSGCKA